MDLILKKRLVLCLSIILCLLFIAGCSGKNNQSENSNQSGITANNSSSAQITTDSAQKTEIESIKQLAKQGKIINCDYAAKTTVIEDVEKNWGNADNKEYIAKAKGTYATFLSHNVVFGFNKGSQVFEVRSFDPSLSKITLSQVKQVFGDPSYDIKSNGEEIIGYVASNEFKLLFVFPEPTTSTKDPYMKHYSVLYPAGTVNSMADDPGREW